MDAEYRQLPILRMIEFLHRLLISFILKLILTHYRRFLTRSYTLLKLKIFLRFTRHHYYHIEHQVL